MDAWLGIADAMCADVDGAAEAAEIRRRLDRVQLDARRQQAYQLRVESRLSYRRIGERMGVDAKTAWRDVDAYARIAVPISEREVAFRESLEGRETALRRVYRVIVDPESSTDDLLRAVVAFDRVQSSIDRLYGLDKPAGGAVDPAGLDRIEDVHRVMIEIEDEVARLREYGLLDGEPATGTRRIVD